MTGDAQDMAARLLSLLPRRWFADAAPGLQTLLQMLGGGWSAIHGLIGAVRAQARIATASGVFLDMVAQDFFGVLLPRRMGESDASFGLRIGQELFRPRGTRAALILALGELTGRAPLVFEPARTTDTGGYGAGGLGFGVAGGWGSLLLPYQSFVTAYRPRGSGIGLLAGYGTGGVPGYGDLSLVATAVSDAAIGSAVARVLPAASIAWLRIES